jgi:hypothetical protein
MGKYIVVEDFESQWFRPPNNVPQVVKFTKDTIIQALPSPVDGNLVTRVDGTLPSFKDGEILLDVVETKVNKIKEEDAKALSDKKDFMKYVYLVGAGIMLWWFIYGRDNKPKYTNESAGYY